MAVAPFREVFGAQLPCSFLLAATLARDLPCGLRKAFHNSFKRQSSSKKVSYSTLEDYWEVLVLAQLPQQLSVAVSLRGG